MRSYKEIEGNLVTLAKKGKFDVIAHGCNCFCTMGAGIAYTLAKEFKCNEFAWEKPIFRGNINKLGLINTGLIVDFNFVLANCYTQYQTGKNIDYSALKLCLIKLNAIFAGKHIGLPQIGCGIAGGKWSVVKSFIQQELKDMHVTVVIYKQ